MRCNAYASRTTLPTDTVYLRLHSLHTNLNSFACSNYLLRRTNKDKTYWRIQPLKCYGKTSSYSVPPQAIFAST